MRLRAGLRGAGCWFSVKVGAGTVERVDGAELKREVAEFQEELEVTERGVLERAGGGVSKREASAGGTAMRVWRGVGAALGVPAWEDGGSQKIVVVRSHEESSVLRGGEMAGCWSGAASSSSVSSSRSEMSRGARSVKNSVS